jgi:hypothetical protein
MMNLGAASLSIALTVAPSAVEPTPAVDLKVLYLGNAGTPRALSYEAFLKEHFAASAAIDRRTFVPENAAGYDVVLLDWSQSDEPYRDRAALKSPLGPRESWNKPVVMLGSAGLLITSPWQTNGTYGCTCMHPFAYNPRDHEVLNTPISINRAATIKRPAPNDTWRDELATAQVDVLPMVKDVDRKYPMGWCTYENTLIEQPEVEFICGGINDKRPAAVGVWRQGNQLHFGFDLSPDEMSDVAQAMLINSIVYIARFTQDRPIVIAPSPFYTKTATRARTSVLDWLQASRFQPYHLDWIDDMVDASVSGSIPARTREAYHTWYQSNMAYLHPGPTGKLQWDEEARSLQIRYDKPELFERGIEALRSVATRDQAATLLRRYAPEGPDCEDADRWAVWYAENGPYLFYCEWGSYRWYIDPLAKQRGVPSNELRGPARADK